MQDVHRRFPGVLVLGKHGARRESDHGLPQAVLVTAVDGVSGPPTLGPRGAAPLFTGRSGQAEFVHVLLPFFSPYSREIRAR